MAMIVYTIHILLLLGTAWLSFNYFAPLHDFPKPPDFLNTFVYLGVVWVSVAYAMIHVIGGGIFGVTGGSFFEGLKMGIMLGCAIAVGRLWPYMLTVGIVALIFNQTLLPGVLILLLSAFCMTLNMITSYVWSRTSL